MDKRQGPAQVQVQWEWSGLAGSSPVASNSDTERGLEVECAS